MIHALNNASLLSDPDPFVLFEQMGVSDAGHAFYLGYELMKAKTALTLSKTYRQDQAMDWGFLTEPEVSHLARRKRGPGATWTSPGKPSQGPPPATPQAQTRNVRDSGRDRHHTEPGRGIEHCADGPPGRPRLEHGADGVASVSHIDDLSEFESAGRGDFPRHRRRATAGTDSRRRGSVANARHAPAVVVAGRILVDACRYYEFRVVELDDREDRTAIVAETIAQGRLRDFFGFNRGKHAVVEAAILATCTAWLPLDEMLVEFRKLAVLVDKTGGPRERAAFTLLHRHVREKPLRSKALTRTRVNPAHDQAFFANSNAEPAALWPFGLGPRGQPAVRRGRLDDRLAWYRAGGRASTGVGG